MFHGNYYKNISLQTSKSSICLYIFFMFWDKRRWDIKVNPKIKKQKYDHDRSLYFVTKENYKFCQKPGKSKRFTALQMQK